jgi:hypothetical protein
LAALINLPSPNHKRLQKLLDQGSPNKATLSNFERPHKISTASNTSIKCVSDLRTRLQNYWTSPVEDDGRGLSPVVKLALSIEHDPDRILEESLCALMQAFRELESRVRGLQVGARQLQADVDRVQKDFEVCCSLHIKYKYIPASLISSPRRDIQSMPEKWAHSRGGGGETAGVRPSQIEI